MKKTSVGDSSHMHGTNAIRDSMQYYRVWIYSSNAVLGVTSAIFILFAVFVLADVRISLLRDVEFFHPTFLYGYGALVLQLGIVQVIGVIGARRLSHKLLSIYWIILLVLTIGDIVVGIFWAFKLDSLKLNLKGKLAKEFLQKYSTDAHFTEIWNRVQGEEHCCGVTGPLDFNLFLSHLTEPPYRATDEAPAQRTPHPHFSLPPSCCTFRVEQTKEILSPNPNLFPSSSQRRRRHKSYSSQMMNENSSFVRLRLRREANGAKSLSLTNKTWSQSAESVSGDEGLSSSEVTDISVPFFCRNPRHPSPQPLRTLEGEGEVTPLVDMSEERRPRPRHVEGDKAPHHGTSQVHSRTKPKVVVYRNGCAPKLREWVEWVSGILFIVGFCIIGFSKICFLLILRYEIREMIEKIQILELEKNGNLSVASPPGSRSGPHRNSIQKQFSTQSGGYSTFAPGGHKGITIKSPQGDSLYFTTLNHHHHRHSQQHELHEGMPILGGRRHSARLPYTESSSFQSGGRKSHSQETVNLTLLISNQRGSATMESSSRIGEETISLKVPTPEEREAKRANFASGCTWECNVSGDSSVSGAFSLGGYEPCSCQTTDLCRHQPPPAGRQELVEVDMEKGRISTGSSLEEPSTQSPATEGVNGISKGPGAGENKEPALIPSTFLRRNGNNNRQVDLESDFIMALIGTPV